MTRFVRIACALAALSLAPSLVVAQVAIAPVPGAAPARDNNVPVPTGTGRIRGRVVDAESGAPLMDVLMRLAGGNLRESPTVGTDDEGRFEFENLPAGRYTLSANKPGYMALSYGQRRAFESGRPIELGNNQSLEGIDFAVPRGGVIVVHVTDENGDALSGIRILAQRFRFNGGQRTLVPVAGSADATDDRGEVRVFGLPPGEYYVGTATTGATFAASTGTSYISTYYPGTASIDAAERVSVQVAKAVEITLPLVAAKLSRISGIVRRVDGSPGSRSAVQLMPRNGIDGFFRGVQVQPDGTFSLADVPPGEYSLMASLATPQPVDRELGVIPISVNGKDLTGLTIATTTGGLIRGRFIFEPQPPADIRMATMRPYLTVTGILGTTPAVQEDGTFVINSVFGPGQVRVTSLPTGWFLKAVRLDGRDLTDVTINLEGRPELAGVEVVLTQKRAEVNGTARDEKGAAASDYAVVVFPEDRALWTLDSRFIASARPDQQGRFRIPGLPPGKYLAAAVDYLETGSERDPDLLGRLRERATPVSLTEGEASTVTLSLQ